MADLNTNTAEPSASIQSMSSLISGAEFLPKAPAVEPKPAVTDAGKGGGEDLAPVTPTPADPVLTPGDDVPEVIENESGKTTDELKEIFQHRIDKVTAKRKAAEEKVTELEKSLKERDDEVARLKTTSSAPPASAPTAADPLADVHTPADLQLRIADAQQWQEWAIRHPDGGTIGEGENELIVTAEQARDLQVKATQVLTTHAPRRAQYLALLEQNTAQAREVYPDIFNEESPDYAAVQNILAAWPEVRRFPDHLEVLGDYLRGQKARLAELAAKKSPVPPAPVVKKKNPPLAPPVPGVSTAPMTPAKEITKRKAADALVESGGNSDAIANYFATLRK